MRPNPFTIRTPESLDTAEIIALFESVFADIPSISQPGHTFIHGSRGSGKSMMFQYMLPKVQLEIVKTSKLGGNPLGNIPYYCFYLPIKAQDFNYLYSAPLKDSQRRIVFSHYLSMRLTEIILVSIKETLNGAIDHDFKESIDSFFKEFSSLVNDYGISNGTVRIDSFDEAIRIIQYEQRAINVYLTRLTLNNNEPYTRGISNFIDFIVPLLKKIHFLTPTQFYVLIDDADELNLDMQKIVNTWVSHRTTNIVSIKVSTQLRYLTYKTSSGSAIEFPHDYTSVDLTQIYTSKINHYLQRVERIIERRLRYYGFIPDVNAFFPSDVKQEKGIRAEADKILKEHSENGISSRPDDDVYRYAIPNYMTNLLKAKKSNMFSYSGFKTLVNVSSGTIRYFLEPASRMYESIESSSEHESQIEFIPPKIQNKITRDWSERRYTVGLPDLTTSFGEEDREVTQLKNLIRALGDLFAHKLLDESASERRVFSIFTDELPSDLEEIISLGISYGYLQKSSIRSKERTGRKNEVIFSRTLAPYFYLDPTGYSGRLSVTVAALQLACIDPVRFVRERLKIDNENNSNTPLFE